MIKTIRGKVSFLGEKTLILEVSGIGYEVWVPGHTLIGYSIGSECFFYTSHIVREDSETLYGFHTLREQEFFEQLISVSGIGPKSGLAIMSLAPMEVITRAIASGDISYLTKISGIGKKTAEKIIIELRDTFAKTESFGKEHTDVFEALESLGYSGNDIRGIISNLQSDTTEGKVREALKLLSKNS